MSHAWQILLVACVCISFGIFAGRTWMKGTLTWSGQMSVIFTSGYDLMTGYSKYCDERICVNLDAGIMKIVLKNAIGKVLPPFILYDEVGSRLLYTKEYFADGRIEIIFVNRIRATPSSPRKLFMQFTANPSGLYRYVQVVLFVP